MDFDVYRDRTSYPFSPPQDGPLPATKSRPLPLIIFVLMPALPKLSDIYFGALGLKNDRLSTRGCG